MTATAAATAGYTLAAGPVRAEAITTDTDRAALPRMAKARWPMGRCRSTSPNRPDRQNPPVILVAMEIFGLHQYVKDVTRRSGKLGAFAVAPDYYFRKGDLAKVSEIAQLMPLVNAKPDAELIADLDATVAWAKSQGGDTSRLGIIGYCRGGRTVWVYCAHTPMSGRVSPFMARWSIRPARRAISPMSSDGIRHRK